MDTKMTQEQLEAFQEDVHEVVYEFTTEIIEEARRENMKAPYTLELYDQDGLLVNVPMETYFDNEETAEHWDWNARAGRGDIHPPFEIKLWEKDGDKTAVISRTFGLA